MATQFRADQPIITLMPDTLDKLSRVLKDPQRGNDPRRHMLLVGVCNLMVAKGPYPKPMKIDKDQYGRTVVTIPVVSNNPPHEAFNAGIAETDGGTGCFFSLQIAGKEADLFANYANQGYMRSGVQFVYVGYDEPTTTSRGNVQHTIHCCSLKVARWATKADAPCVGVMDKRTPTPQGVPSAYYGGSPAPVQQGMAPGYAAAPTAAPYGSPAPAQQNAAPSYNAAPNAAYAPAPQSVAPGYAAAPTAAPYGNPAPAQQNAAPSYNAAPNAAYGNPAPQSAAPHPDYGNAVPVQQGMAPGAPVAQQSQTQNSGREVISGPNAEDMSAVLDDDGDLPF